MNKKTVSGIVEVLLIVIAGFVLTLSPINQVFADPPFDTPPGQKNSEKVTICHIPPGNPRQAKTMELPRAAVPAHLAHGDTYGRCLVKIDEIQTESFVEDSRMDGNGQVAIIHTKENIQFYENGQEIKRIALNKGDQVLISEQGPPAVVVYRVSEEAGVDQMKRVAFDRNYKLYDRQGNITASGEIEEVTEIVDVLGDAIYVGRAGHSLSKLNTSTGEYEWVAPTRTPMDFKTIYFNRPAVNKVYLLGTGIIDDQTGEILRESSINIHVKQVSETMKYVAGVSRSGSHKQGTRELILHVFNSEFQEIERWDGLFSVGNFPIQIFENREIIAAPPINGEIFLGNIQNPYISEIIKPPNPITLMDITKDEENVLLFISGSSYPGQRDFSIEQYNRDRFVHIVDIKQEQYLSQTLCFLKSEISKERFRGPFLEVDEESQILKVDLPNKLVRYRYD